MKSIFERTQNNVLSMSITSDGKTMAIGTRTGEVHLWSTFSTRLTSKPPLLKSFCRFRIHTHPDIKRNNIVNLPISQTLINYLLYKDI